MSEFGRLKAAASGDVETMFKMVERKPYSGSVIGEDTTVPLGLANVAQDLRDPMYLQFKQAGGVPNGNFYEGPPDGTGSVIDNVSNRLPGWVIDTANSSSNIEWQWDPYRIIAVSTASATAGEVSYIYTEVPITQVGRIIRPRSSLFFSTSSLITLTFDFRDADGDVVSGSSLTSEMASGDYSDTVGTIEQWRTPTWGTEVYARLTLGVETSGSGASDLTSFSDAWIETPVMYDITIPMYRNSFDPSASTNYSVGPANTSTGHFYTATAPGFVMGFSGSTDSTISAGKLQVFPRHFTDSANIDILGDDVSGTYFDSTHSQVWAERLLNVAQDTDSGKLLPYDFEAGDQLRMQVEANGSWASTSANWSFHMRLIQTFGGSSDAGDFWTIAA